MKRRATTRWLLATATVLAAAYAAFAAGATAAPDATSLRRGPPPATRDITAAFTPFGGADALAGPAIERAFGEVADDLRATRIVIVPSYLADGLLLTNRLGLTDYFASQIATLRADGFTVEMAPVDTEAAVADNAAALARFVAADTKPVCFVSHSKGGLDVLAFLVGADAATRGRIACWLALQAPFRGSPIADLAGGSKPLRAVADPLARWLGGSGRSLTDLTVAVREPWMATHDGSIRAVVATVPTLAVVTRIDAPSFGLPTLYMRPSYDWMSDRGIANDGLVPVASAVLPGARYVELSGLDHTDTVADNPVLDTAAERLLLLKALLALTLAER